MRHAGEGHEASRLCGGPLQWRRPGSSSAPRPPGYARAPPPRLEVERPRGQAKKVPIGTRSRMALFVARLFSASMAAFASLSPPPPARGYCRCRSARLTAQRSAPLPSPCQSCLRHTTGNSPRPPSRHLRDRKDDAHFLQVRSGICFWSISANSAGSRRIGGVFVRLLP